MEMNTKNMQDKSTIKDKLIVKFLWPNKRKNNCSSYNTQTYINKNKMGSPPT